jgi:hypothetical protein
MTWEFYKPQVVMVDEIQQEKYYQNIFERIDSLKASKVAIEPGVPLVRHY